MALIVAQRALEDLEQRRPSQLVEGALAGGEVGEDLAELLGSEGGQVELSRRRRAQCLCPPFGEAAETGEERGDGGIVEAEGALVSPRVDLLI